MKPAVFTLNNKEFYTFPPTSPAEDDLAESIRVTHWNILKEASLHFSSSFSFPNYNCSSLKKSPKI